MSTYLVADIGGTSVKIGFVIDGTPHGYTRVFPTHHVRNSDPVESLARLIATATDEAQLTPDMIIATVPGFLDKTAEHVLFAANVPELNGCALVDELTRTTHVPVILERDAVMSLMGEYAAGGCIGAASVVGLFFGTGVGAAYLDQGRVFRGAGWALEIGHMPYSGVRRWLGSDRPECLEAYVSGKVLEQITRENDVALGDVFTAAKTNPALADHVADFVRNQAHAVGSAVAILSPETILLGGGICEMSDFPKAELVAAIQSSFPFEQIGQVVDVRWATLGWRSVLYGAPLVAAGRNFKPTQHQRRSP
jgi:predicted NBD/HSP70 family sugar kinase